MFSKQDHTRIDAPQSTGLECRVDDVVDKNPCLVVFFMRSWSCLHYTLIISHDRLNLAPCANWSTPLFRCTTEASLAAPLQEFHCRQQRYCNDWDGEIFFYTIKRSLVVSVFHFQAWKLAPWFHYLRLGGDTSKRQTDNSFKKRRENTETKTFFFQGFPEIFYGRGRRRQSLLCVFHRFEIHKHSCDTHFQFSIKTQSCSPHCYSASSCLTLVAGVGGYFWQG